MSFRKRGHGRRARLRRRSKRYRKYHISRGGFRL